MIIKNWPDGVNTKFYAGKRTAKENVEFTENISGRVVGHKINSKALMKISVSIKMTKLEQNIFWAWFNDGICQTSGFFYCPALGDDPNQLYRFTSIPESEDTNQKVNEFNLDIEEAL